MSEKFNFCIGRPWETQGNHLVKEDHSLCIYAFGSQVHYGTMEEAIGLRDEISTREEREYFVYRVSTTPVDN